MRTTKNKKQSTLWRLLVLLQNHKGKVVFLFVLVLISQAANITVPFISKTIIDTLTAYITNPGGILPWQTLMYAGLGIIVATIIASVIQSIYNYNLFKLATKTEDEIRTSAFEKYMKLHVLFHHGSSSGQIIGRIERGGMSVYAILHDIIGQNLLPPLIVFVATFIVLLSQNVWIALAVLLPFPIYFLITNRLSRKIYEIEQESNDAFEAVSKEMYDVAGNVLTVKKFSQEKEETDSKRVLMHGARQIQYSAEKLWGIIESIQTTISVIGRVAVLGLSAWFVLRGSATIGEFVLYVTLQNMAYQPLSQLSAIFPRMRRNMTRLERLFTILDESIMVTDKKDAIELPPFEREIAFNNLFFAYHNVSEWALKNISVTIPQGKTVALVGRSGSGKTTFINLLLRSYDPQQGSITFDGIDIRDVTQKSLRNQIAIVPQEVDLFSRTVTENIAYGQDIIDTTNIENAAKTALAHDFIMKLEHGYDTVVGERGIKLSGGERQRVGIARAVLRDPKLLILDEATSHLDTESEKIITEATNALIKNRTSVVIAHRLSTVLHADKILVFNKGEIEAEGTHSELLKSSPTYAKLHSLQFAE